MVEVGQNRQQVPNVKIAEQEESTPPSMGVGCEVPLSFDIGAAVTCEGRRCGKLIRVVVDPVTEQVTDLVVARGVLQRDPRVVPVSKVKAAIPGEVSLTVQSSDLTKYKAFREFAFRMPSIGWNSGRYQPQDVRYSMSPYQGLAGESVQPRRKHRLHEGVSLDQRVIGQGTQVRDAEGNAGEVDHVLVDCLRSDITHIVVRHGLLRATFIVPVAMISRVDDETVYLAANRAAIKALPRFDPEK